MRIPPWALLASGLLLIAAVIAAAVIAAGGDEDAPAGTDTTPTPTRVPEDAFGEPPTMTAHVHSIAPEHSGRIKKAATVEQPDRSTGICAEVSYQDLPQNNLSFQMAVDGAIVTDKLTIEITEGTFEAPERGRLCYATPEGLAPGVHDAAVAVQDPDNLTGPPDEIVAWKFEVVP